MPLFSNLGLGVAILLVFLVLIGLAIKPEDKSWPYLFGIVGGIIFIVILARTGGLRLIFGDNIQYWLQQNSAWMILFVFLILIGVAVVVGVRKEENDIRIPRS
jgi:di/tricarboxylate transporter